MTSDTKKAKQNIIENLRWLKLENWVDTPKYGEQLSFIEIVPVAFDDEEHRATTFTNLKNGKTYNFNRGQVVSCFDELKKDYQCENGFVFCYTTDLFFREINNFHNILWTNNLPKDKQTVLKMQQRKIENIITARNMDSANNPIFNKNSIIDISSKAEKLFRTAYEFDFEMFKTQVDKPNSNKSVFHYTK